MQTLRNSELDAQKTAWPQHMQRAIQLAASVFSAAPNPRVGCVIVVSNGEVGDSVVVPRSALASIRAYAKKLQCEIATRKVDKFQRRVWMLQKENTNA